MTSKFSIKDLERLSGIKAHTIRIWEQRYNLLNPERTDTNIRYYSNKDLQLILNVSLLNNHGIKISRIASLSPEEISREVSKITQSELNEDEQMYSLIVSMIELDEAKFETIVSRAIEVSGFQQTVLNVIYPFMEKIGVMWQIGTINPAQEHFISNLVRQKFIVAIDQQKGQVKAGAKKIILYLPDGELHELSLLFYTYLLRQQGHHCIYLGQSVPFDDLQEVTATLQPDYLLTVITNTLRDEAVEDYVDRAQKAFTSSKHIFTGYQIASLQLSSYQNAIVSSSTLEMIEILQNL